MADCHPKLAQYRCAICSRLAGVRFEDCKAHFDLFHVDDVQNVVKQPAGTWYVVDSDPIAFYLHKEANKKMDNIATLSKCYGQKNHEFPSRIDDLDNRISCERCQSCLCIKDYKQRYVESQYLKEDFLLNTKPFKGGVGQKLLEKMGWKEGQGLGKNQDGVLSSFVCKIPKKKHGLGFQEKGKPKKSLSNPQETQNVDVGKKLKNMSLSSSYVSDLQEYCAKIKYQPPVYEICMESGPPHQKQFKIKVFVNGKWYVPLESASNKKEAKNLAAKNCLRKLGWVRISNSSEPTTKQGVKDSTIPTSKRDQVTANIHCAQPNRHHSCRNAVANSVFFAT